MAGPWEKYGQQPAGDPIIAPADPYKQAAEQRAEQDQAFEAERLRLAQEAAARANETKAPSGYRFASDGNLEPIPGGPAERGIMGNSIPQSTYERANAEIGFFVTMQNALDSFEDDFGGNLLGGVENTLQAYSPVPIGTPGQSEWWANFKGLDNQIRNDLFGSALTATEKKAYSDTTVEPGMNPEKIRDNLQRRRDILRGALNRRREFYIANGFKPDAVNAIFSPLDEAAQLEQVDQAQREGDEPVGSAIVDPGASDPGGPAPPSFRPGGPTMQPGSETGFRTVTDPKWQAIAGEYRQRLAQGQSAREIIPWLRSQGASPETLTGAMAQIKFRAENPQVPIDAYDITSTQRVPLSSFERGITEYGSGKAGAFAIGAGQFLTGNTLDNIASDPERARLAMQTAQAQNPGAYMAGEVTGGVLGSLAGSAGLARAGVSNALARGIGADAFMGGANAAGMADDGGRVENALLGATVGAVGSVAGNALARGASRVISPTGGKMAPLYESGVRPTLGQRVADKGTVGRVVNATEEALQSVPVVGSAIRGARQEARDQFQIGAFNQALAEVGEQLPKGMKPGTAPNAYTQQVFNRVYDEARSGMRVVGDDQLRADMVALRDEVEQLAEPSAKRFANIMENNVMRRMKDNALDGDAYKNAYSDLGKRIREIRNNPNGDYELATALENLQGSLDAAARRHSAPEAVELLDAADAGYAKLVRIEEAASKVGGEAGTFTPNQFDRAVQKTSGGVRSKAYLRGDALMQDYAEAGRGLSDTLPNSGTADRVMAGYAVGAPVAGTAAYMEPTSAVALGTIGAAYAPGARKVMQKALAPGGAKARKIAERLRKRAQLIGSVTGASGVAAIGTNPGQ